MKPLNQELNKNDDDDDIHDNNDNDDDDFHDNNDNDHGGGDIGIDMMSAPGWPLYSVWEHLGICAKLMRKF